MGNGPEEEQYGKRRQQTAHGIHHQRHRLRRRSKVGEETRREHKNGVARRVTHLKLVGLNYKLAAVPVRRGRLQSEPIGGQRNDKHHPSGDVVDQLVLFRYHTQVVTE